METNPKPKPKRGRPTKYPFLTMKDGETIRVEMKHSQISSVLANLNRRYGGLWIARQYHEDYGGCRYFYCEVDCCTSAVNKDGSLEPAFGSANFNRGTR